VNFWGPGGSGKGVFVDLLMHLWGEYATPISLTGILEDSDSDRRLNSNAKLFGKRLAVCNEVPKGKRLDSAAIKLLTGEGLMQGRKLYEGATETEQTHKIIIASNDALNLELDGAMRGRVIIVPFTQQFRQPGKETVDLRKILKQPENLPGILQWCVDGYRLWRQEGLRSKLPQAIAETTQKYFAQMDPMERFLEDFVQIAPLESRLIPTLEWFCLSEDLFRAWKSFCYQQGLDKQVSSLPLFLGSLKDKTGLETSQPQGKGFTRKRGVMWLRLKNEAREKGEA
jgi:P4 family phage/plasmid primase-like protien